MPLTEEPKLSWKYGTRHRAAIGMTETSDAACLVVSEETGRLSIAVKGELFYNLTIDDIRMMLIDELRPKQDIEEVEEDDN